MGECFGSPSSFLVVYGDFVTSLLIWPFQDLVFCSIRNVKIQTSRDQWINALVFISSVFLNPVGLLFFFLSFFLFFFFFFACSDTHLYRLYFIQLFYVFSGVGILRLLGLTYLSSRDARIWIEAHPSGGYLCLFFLVSQKHHYLWTISCRFKFPSGITFFFSG